MSLATRCTACGTVFRVVQDQLKVSEGWVRCGRCHDVFNALEELFDLEPSATAAQAPADPPVWAGTALAEQVVRAPAAIEPVQPDGRLEPAFAAPPAAPEPEDSTATPASRVAASDRIDFADARFNDELLAGVGSEESEAPAEVARSEPAPLASPEFLRQAERRAQWGRPRSVAAVTLLCLVLVLALALQAAIHYRDALAATVPSMQPALQALCEAAGCRIGPLQRIDDILIESSALTSAPGGDPVRLAIVLRNRGALPLAMPSVELTLTDAGGQMLVRRALSPSDFGVAQPTLPAASEAALQLVLSTHGRRASGYTVEPFYP